MRIYVANLSCSDKSKPALRKNQDIESIEASISECVVHAAIPTHLVCIENVSIWLWILKHRPTLQVIKGM